MMETRHSRRSKVHPRLQQRQQRLINAPTAQHQKINHDAPSSHKQLHPRQAAQNPSPTSAATVAKSLHDFTMYLLREIGNDFAILIR